MTGNGHFDWAEILDRVEGRVSPDTGFWGHLDHCAECASARAEAESLLGSMFLAAAPKPGAGLVARTWAAIARESLTARVREATADFRDVITEVWATLSADSLHPSAATRSVDAATPRLLVYETPDYSISLSFLPGTQRGRVDVVGNVVPKKAPELPANGQVQVRNRPELAAAVVSPFGEFRLTDLTLDESTALTVEFAEVRIHLGPLSALRDE